MELNKQITSSYILNKLKDTGNASSTLISDEFGEEKEYLTGEYCIKDNALYIFTADKSAGEWDESKAAPTSIGSVLSEQNENLGGLRFGVDGDGNGGYYKADDSFVPFSSDPEAILFIATYSTDNKQFSIHVGNVNCASGASSKTFLGNGSGGYSTSIATISLANYQWTVRALKDVKGTYNLKAGESKTWAHNNNVTIILYG